LDEWEGRRHTKIILTTNIYTKQAEASREMFLLIFFYQAAEEGGK
jgi:hypothetical protein